MKTTCTSATYHRGALHLDLVIHGPQSSWIRFSHLIIKPDQVRLDDLIPFMSACVEAHTYERDNQDEPLF